MVGYRLYKRCKNGSAEEDSERAEPAEEKQEYALDNAGLQCDENGNTGGKTKATQL